MVTIVEDNKEAESTLRNISRSMTKMVLFPILSDARLHPAANKISLLGIGTKTRMWIFPFDHPQAKSLNIHILNDPAFNTAWTPNLKVLRYYMPDSGWDLNSLEYLGTGQVTSPELFYTSLHKKMYEQFWGETDVNNSIPILKHAEFLEAYRDHAFQILTHDEHLYQTQAYGFLTTIAIPALHFIERSGLHVDMEVAKKHFPERTIELARNNLVYSEYFPYTTTGRVSNKFGGLNYAALSKSDGIRESFTSRFGEDGILVNADFESFHLRLIADMIGYNFPKHIAVHEYLARQYFSKDIISQEEYDEGKKITFRYLYGENRDRNVPEFFKEVYNYVDMLMVLLERNGHIVSPYFKREIRKNRIENPTPQKVFNYMIQLAETEVNMEALAELEPLFLEKKSKPILYTYDSVLFDLCLEDGKEFFDNVIKVLSHNGKFPMRISYGKNYHDLKRA